MNICPSCGGIIGRDCFNVRECIQIGNQIDTEIYQELKHEIFELKEALRAHGILPQKNITTEYSDDFPEDLRF